MSAVAVTALSVVHFAQADGVVGEATYLGVTVGASISAWWGTSRLGGWVRLWLAVGLTASALGDVLYQIVVSVRGFEPDASVADVGWIASYVGLAVAMLVLLRLGRRRARTDVDGLIDMAVVALVCALVLWQLWLSSTFSDDSVSLFVRVLWAAYPVLDATLLVLVIRTLAERRTRTSMGLLLASGVVCWLVSDFWFLIGVPEGRVTDLLDIGWMVGAALLAGAAWSDTSERTDASTDPSTREVGKLRIALGMSPLLVPSLIELLAYWNGEDANPVPLLLATFVLVALASMRALRILRLRDDARRDLEQSEQLYRALAANSADAVMLLDASGTIINDAPNLAALVGYPGEPTAGHRALDFVSDADVQSHLMFDEALLSPGVVLSGEVLVRRPDGSELWLGTRAVNLLDEPAVAGIVVNVHDITDRKRAEQELVHQAFHDSLTGLANRLLFRDRIEHALSRSVRTGLDPAIVYIDLDGFKNVNDGLGHEAGDRLLEEVSSRVLAVVRSGDTVARLGGDEFAVLVEESRHVAAEAEAIADRILQSLSAPIVLGEHEVTLSASVGIAIADADTTASSLLRDADVAMYRAKSSGRSRWVVYEPTMRAAAVERLQIENDLAHAVTAQQLRLVYQPVVELETNRVVGFEALVRWDHPSLGTIMPDRFIPIAEQSGAILAIGRWVLHEACRTAAGWMRSHDTSLTMAVNLSGRQLSSPGLIDDVRAALTAAHLDPSSLVLEMTETALVQDAAMAAGQLRLLRSLGVRLAIDDFGTGYSSLSYLRQFPVDILKIDRSFVSTIADPTKVPAIMRGLLDLGHTLRLEMVAEGIESEAQLSQLREQRCELGQGYLFSPPMPAAEAERFLGTVVSHHA
ncbi:MAG: putative bifunctional diguanylate cyclase/phosphodiesterase [Ilumatobacteraceae bacterium]